MQNECNNGLSLYQPLPSLSWHSSLPFFGFSSQSLYSSKLGDRSNRQTFGISCEEMWWSTKIKLAVQPSRFGWNAHRLHLKVDDMTAPQKLGPRHLHHPPVAWPSHDVVTPNQIFQDGRFTILCRGMHSHCPRHLVTRILTSLFSRIGTSSEYTCKRMYLRCLNQFRQPAALHVCRKSYFGFFPALQLLPPCQLNSLWDLTECNFQETPQEP